MSGPTTSSIALRMSFSVRRLGSLGAKVWAAVKQAGGGKTSLQEKQRPRTFVQRCISCCDVKSCRLRITNASCQVSSGQSTNSTLHPIKATRITGIQVKNVKPSCRTSCWQGCEGAVVPGGELDSLTGALSLHLHPPTPSKKAVRSLAWHLIWEIGERAHGLRAVGFNCLGWGLRKARQANLGSRAQFNGNIQAHSWLKSSSTHFLPATKLLDGFKSPSSTREVDCLCLASGPWGVLNRSRVLIDLVLLFLQPPSLRHAFCKDSLQPLPANQNFVAGPSGHARSSLRNGSLHVIRKEPEGMATKEGFGGFRLYELRNSHIVVAITQLKTHGAMKATVLQLSFFHWRFKCSGRSPTCSIGINSSKRRTMWDLLFFTVILPCRKLYCSICLRIIHLFTTGNSSNNRSNDMRRGIEKLATILGWVVLRVWSPSEKYLPGALPNFFVA